MKNKNIIGVILNIVLSVFYIFFSFVLCVFGVTLFSYTPKDNITVAHVFLLSSSIVFIFTVFFCIIGIILSVIFRKKEKHTLSIIIQFLPFATVVLAIFLMFVSMILENIV